MISWAVMSRRFVSELLLVSLPWLTGCGVFRHVNVEPLAVTSQRPSNVGAYVAVTDGDDALTELTSASFRVYENEQLVPPEQTELTLLDRSLVAAHQALLLVDMSAAQTPAQRTVAAKAAQGFVQKLAPHQPVMVFAFDGGANLVPIATLPRSNQPVTMAALENFTPRDPSRNLNGAIVAALAKLDAALSQSGKPVRVGTLIVFASGPDVAGRVDRDKVHDAVWQSPHDVIGIGIGLGEQADAIEALSRRGLVRAEAADTLPIAFEEAADKALAELQKHYLVSYCSPARAGGRRLRLEVTYTNKQGEEHHGDFETDFSAKGFGPGCNPQVTPRFVYKPRAVDKPEPAPSKAGGADEPAPSKPGEREPADDAPVAPPDQSGYAK
jgi:hypothetical protein